MNSVKLLKCGAAIFFELFLLVASANAETPRWISLDKVAAFSRNMRLLEHHGLLTGIKCGVIDGRPAIKFTYKLVDRPVSYRYVWSVVGEGAFKQRARMTFKPGVEVFICHFGEFYYGTQNIR